LGLKRWPEINTEYRYNIRVIIFVKAKFRRFSADMSVDGPEYRTAHTAYSEFPKTLITKLSSGQ